MDDIIRRAIPPLRLKAQEVETPLSDGILFLGKNAAIPEAFPRPCHGWKNESPRRRWPAPQLDVSRRIIAVLVPNPGWRRQSSQEAYALQEIMYNPASFPTRSKRPLSKVGEGCLSVDHRRKSQAMSSATPASLLNMSAKKAKKQKLKLKGYNAIVVQHEIDHINGIMFYDRIDPEHPLAVKDGLLIIE